MNENSLNILDYYFVFRCRNNQMELSMMETEKVVRWKEKELKLKFYNNFR